MLRKHNPGLKSFSSWAGVTIPPLPVLPAQPREDMDKSFTPVVPCAGLTFQHRQRAGGCRRRRQGRTGPWFSCGQCGRWSTGSPTLLWEETRRSLGMEQRGPAADLTQPGGVRLEILASLSNLLLVPGRAAGWIATGVVWKQEFCVPAAESCYVLPDPQIHTPSQGLLMWMPKTAAHGSLEEILFNFWPLFPAAFKDSLECGIFFLFCYLDFTKLFLPCFWIRNRSSSVNLTIHSSLQCNFPRSFWKLMHSRSGDYSSISVTSLVTLSIFLTPTSVCVRIKPDLSATACLQGTQSFFSGYLSQNDCLAAHSS